METTPTVAVHQILRLLRIKSLSTAGDWAMLLLRCVFGGYMLAGHGWRKMVKFSDIAPDFYNFLGIGSGLSLALAVFAEVVCAALLIAGLATRLATIPLMITMAVAFFLVHADDSILDREMAMLYLVVYAVIYLIGPGRYSIDKVLFGVRQS